VREVSSPASLLGPAVGAFLFAAELMQARRLATGDVQATRQAARTIGSTHGGIRWSGRREAAAVCLTAARLSQSRPDNPIRDRRRSVPATKRAAR